MSKDVQLIEGWLWKAKRGMTTTWKKHYVRADNQHFYQYSGTTKPTKDDEPKYVLDIAICKVRTSSARKFAFEICEHGGKPMTFATDDSVSYKKWIRILSEKTEAAARIKALQTNVLGGSNNDLFHGGADESSPLSKSVDTFDHPADHIQSSEDGLHNINPLDEIMTQEEEVLMQHIMDGAKSFGDGRLNLDTIRSAIRMADPLLQEDRIITLVKKSTVITADGKISVNDFRRFWREHAALLLPTRRGSVTSPFAITHPTADSMSSLSSGALCEDIFLNGAEELLEEVITPVMLRMEVPMLSTCASYISTSTPVFDPKDATSESIPSPTNSTLNLSQLNQPQNWYMQQLEIDNRIAQLTAQIEEFLNQRNNADDAHLVNSNSSNAGSVPPGTHTHETRQQLHRQLLSACEELHSLWEHFYHTAIKAAQIISNEYILPNHLKTLIPVDSIVANHTTVPTEVGELDTYILDGVHVQLLWQHLPADANATDNHHAIAKMNQLEELLGKIAEVEFKESEYLNNTLDYLLWSDRMDQLHLKQSSEDVKNNTIKNKNNHLDEDDDRPTPHFSEFLKVKRCFHTIVDYSGMRFVAFVPSNDLVQELYIDEPDEKLKKHLPERDDQDEEEDEEDDADEEDIGLAILEDELGATMNIRYAENAMYLMEWKTMQCKTTTSMTPQGGAKDTLRRYVHGHVDQLLPADLCRPHTHDALVKRLRPEYVRMFRLSHASNNRFMQTQQQETRSEPDSVSDEKKNSVVGESLEDNHAQLGIPCLFSLNTMDNNNNDVEDASQEESVGEEKRSQSQNEEHFSPHLRQKTREWTTACGYYYKQHLPFIAQLLDTFQLQPFDSYSLSRTLHTYGVNLRHLGILFTLCKNQTVKQLLFAEVFARSVKRLYREMMSAMSKEERQRTIYNLNVAARDKSVATRGNTVSTALQETDERGELIDQYLHQRQSLVLTIFNRILRREHLSVIPGKKTLEEMEENNAKFFQLLFGIIQQKFGVTMRSSRDLDHCPWHPNQVFLAMQYHLQVRFKEDCYACIERERFISTREFTLFDMVDFFLPKHRCGQIFTEDISYLLQQKHRFLSLDLMSEATALFAWEHHLAQQALFKYHVPLRHSSSSMMPPAQDTSETQTQLASPAAAAIGSETRVLSWQHIEQVAHVTYQITLCLLLQKRFEEAFRIASQYLASAFTCLQSVVSGRILAMVVSAAYHSGHHSLAMHAFDGSLSLLQRALPEYHPALALPMLALADAYLTYYDTHFVHQNHTLQSQNYPGDTETTNPAMKDETDRVAVSLEATGGLQQAKWLLQMAWTTVSETPYTSLNVLNGHQYISRFAFALEYRLANLLVVLGDYREAMPHYHALLKVVDFHQQQRLLQLTSNNHHQQLTSSHKQTQQDHSRDQQEVAVAVASVYFQEKLHCLYHLCLAHYHCEEHDVALQFGQQTLQCASFGEQHPDLIRNVLMHDHWHASVQRVVVSTLLICYDIHATKNETEISLEMLQAAWRLLRGQHPVYNANGKWYFRNARHIIQVLTQVSLKTLEMALSALPLQSRITLEALAKEYVQEHGGFDQQSVLLMSSVAGVANNKRGRRQGGYADSEGQTDEVNENTEMVTLNGEVLNPMQVVQFACLAVAEVLFLGLGVDYVHWLLQRHVSQQQLHTQVGSVTGATQATSNSGPSILVGSRHVQTTATRRHGSPLKASTVSQHNNLKHPLRHTHNRHHPHHIPTNKRNANTQPVALDTEAVSATHGIAPEDLFLQRLPATHPHHLQEEGVDKEEDEEARLVREMKTMTVPTRLIVESLPVAAQAAAVLMVLQQPQEFAKFLVGVNLLRKSY